MPVNLNEVALFADLDESELSRLQDVVREELFIAGHRIFREGDMSDAFYAIKSGSVKIVKEAPGQAPALLASLKEGDFFGEMGVMTSAPRSASAYTLERSVLYRIPKIAFLAFLDTNPVISMKVRSAIMRRRSGNVFTMHKSGTKA